MNEYTMELIDRFAVLLEENTELRVKLRALENAVKAEEIEDALGKEESKGSSWVRFNYAGTLKTETINAIMGWTRSREATEIIEGLRKEAEDGESV